jgi:hypothetical protein
MMGNSGSFKPGSIPWNKGIKGSMGANSGSFKKGSLPVNTKPEGHVHKHVRIRENGYVDAIYTINIDWRGNRRANNHYRWYLWECHNQRDRPAGFVLTVMDNNPNNLNIENLELITRAELIARNRHKITSNRVKYKK